MGHTKSNRRKLRENADEAFPMARLKAEYGVDATYERVDFNVARWVECDDRMSPLALAV